MLTDKEIFKNLWDAIVINQCPDLVESSRKRDIYYSALSSLWAIVCASGGDINTLRCKVTVPLHYRLLTLSIYDGEPTLEIETGRQLYKEEGDRDQEEDMTPPSWDRWTMLASTEHRSSWKAFYNAWIPQSPRFLVNLAHRWYKKCQS